VENGRRLLWIHLGASPASALEYLISLVEAG